MRENTPPISPQPSPGGPIDAHVHVWTNDLDRYPLAVGFSPSQMSPASFMPENLFAHCIPSGVNRIVLIQMVFYASDNSYMLDCMQQYPRIFSGVALIDEKCNDPASEMIRLKQLRVRGVRIGPPCRGATDWLDNTRMHSMWRTGAEHGIAMCALVDPEDLSAIDRMCYEHPETPVVIDHCARIRVDSASHNSDLNLLCVLARHRNIHIKLSAFYFLAGCQPPYTKIVPMLRQLIDAFGPSRSMWATDCPFQVDPPHTYQASLELICNELGFLSANERNQILEKTAERLFF